MDAFAAASKRSVSAWCAARTVASAPASLSTSCRPRLSACSSSTSLRPPRPSHSGLCKSCWHALAPVT